MRFLFVVFFLIFVGCGGGGGSKSSDPLSFQEWHFIKDVDFFKENNISLSADVNFTLKDQFLGEDVKIAIIDDGIDLSHPDLNITYSDTSILSAHGSAVTGVINAQINNIGFRGILPKAKIYFFKLPEPFDDEKIIETFYKIYDMGIRVINCSWGTEIATDAEKEAIKDLASKGVIFIFAVGNNNTTLPEDESAIPEVIAVGSTDEQNLRAYYSNYGDYLDIMAPGGVKYSIPTTDIAGDAGYSVDDYIYYYKRVFRGTSASAPIITSIVALIKKFKPDATYKDIELIFEKTADKIGKYPYTPKNIYYGYGKINFDKVLVYLKAE